MNELISIIVPVYNVEKYLRRCVNSILSQRGVKLELILVDDGSTDGSGIICDEYLRDERVKVIHQTNSGVSAARNAGIEIADGDYLYFVDSDDWLAVDALSKMITGGNGADLIFCGAFSAKQIGDNQFEHAKYTWWDDKSKPYAVKDKYQEIFDKSVTLWNKMIRRSVIADIRFQTSMTYGEDCDFLCRILDNVNTAVIVPEMLYYYFVNRQGSVVAAKIDERSLELLDNAKIIYDLLAERGQTSSGIRRIYIAAAEVFGKIPLTLKDIRASKVYIQYARKAMRYPKFRERLRFYFDTEVHRGVRLMYLRILLNPWHLIYRLIRSRLKGRE